MALLCLPFMGLYAQNTRTINGTVTDGVTGKPMAGAVVGVDGIAGATSTFTDSIGHYVLTIPQQASQLLISAPDHNAVRLGIAKTDQQRGVILFSNLFRDEYASGNNAQDGHTTAPSDYSNAVSVEEEIQRTLGAQVFTTMRNGTSGTGGVMRIGGINTLNANAQPLVVIDGVVMDMQYNRVMLHQGFYNNILSAINPADIESISVLRNGQALYGAKAANGVILITTRRSHSMATRITASLSAGVTMQPRSIDMMDASQYKSYAADLLSTTSTTITDFKFQNNTPSYYYYPQYNNNTDWRKLVYRNAMTQNYRVNVEGGDDVATYNLSLGYINNQSTLKENMMNRINIRFNTDITFTKQFQTRFDASFSTQNRDLRNDGAHTDYNEGTPTSPSFLAYVKSPMLSPYSYSNGVLSDSFVDTSDESYLNEALAQYANYNYQLANPLAINQYGSAQNKNYFETSMLNIAITPRYTFGDHLALSEHFSYNLVNSSEFYYIPMNGVPAYYVSGVGATRENETRALASKQNSVMSDTRLDWKQRFGMHDLHVFLGSRINWESYTLSTQLGYNTGNDKTPFMSSSLLNATTDGTSGNWNTMANYMQANYNYLQRYYLQLNLTAETSSRYGKDASGTLKLLDAPWAVFPGIEAAWVMTNEPWLASVKGLDYLRLSAGFDITGNDDIDCYAARSYFSAFTFMKSISALAFSNIGNTQLRPETTRRMNIGLESNLLGNRLNVRLGYFTSHTSDLLAYQTLGYLSGLSRNWTNGGKMKNTGFDVGITGKLLSTRNITWELGATAGHYKNTVTALPDGSDYIDTEIYGATIRTEVGQAVNLFYGYKTNGVFSTSEETSKAGLYTIADNGVDRNYFQAGDMHFVDVSTTNSRGENAPGQIDEADRIVIGDPNPDLYGNIFTSLTWKRLRLDVDFNYSLGGDVFNYMRSQLEGGSRFLNQTAAMTSRWMTEGQVTDIPRATFQDPMGNARFSDRWIEDGSYLRLKTITLSYQLPMNTTFLKGMEFWIQANNLLTFSRYLGSDPECTATGSVIGQGIDLGELPISRSLVAGVKIKL